jgi:PAS domain-containing protein/ActR/RegA family two-component response regulator
MPQSLRILLIADDPEVIRRVGQGLQREEAGLIMIEGAESLATARRRLGSAAYDLALVDLALGEADALRLLSELRELAPELPFVALASGPEAPDARACLALGAQDRLGPEALDSAGMLDRLQGAVARARVDQDSRRRSRRIAASLGSAGDLAWHYERGEEEVWLAAADPAEWQLPAAESRESLESLRQRLHPDDRELTLRRIAELFDTAIPWQVEARVKVGGGAYRWCTLRGRSQLDAQGSLERASGVVSDTQRQQKRSRDLEHGRRFLRAVFDSNRVPQAILDASGMITDCNQSWYNLDDAACHAGHRFSPGQRFVDPAANAAPQGDLDLAALARGVRQVLGGVVEHFECEYGDGERRWRMAVSPLLNPGIAGAVVSHEEITASRRADEELHALLREARTDLHALAGAQFRLAPDFSVLAINPAAEALGRAPQLGRDVLKVLPRLHADAVGAALAEIAAGATQAVHDTRPEQGKVTRWLVSSRLDAEGRRTGFVALGIEVTDLVQAKRPRPEPEATNEIPGLRAALAAAEQELESLRAAAATAAGEGDALRAAAEARAEALDADLASARLELEAARASLGEARDAAARAGRELDEARGAREQAGRELDEARRESRELKDAEAAARQEYERAIAELGGELGAERTRHAETLAALAAAGQVPMKMRADLDRARLELRAELETLVDRAFGPILGESEGGHQR